MVIILRDLVWDTCLIFVSLMSKRSSIDLGNTINRFNWGHMGNMSKRSNEDLGNTIKCLVWDTCSISIPQTSKRKSQYLGNNITDLVWDTCVRLLPLISKGSVKILVITTNEQA